MDAIRDEWSDDLVVTAVTDEPGAITISIRDSSGTWAALEVGTGDVDDVVALLRAAEQEAEANLRSDLDNNLDHYLRQKSLRKGQR